MLYFGSQIIFLRLTTAVLATVPYSFPTQDKSEIVVSTSQQDIRITSSLFSITETTGYSCWDVAVTIPNIQGQGALQWFCPDDYCQEKGWVSFSSLPTNVTYSWFAMSAVRWLPLGNNNNY